MSEQKPGDRCACADFLNFGEPQPDCHRCDGSGTVKHPAGDTGPVFGPTFEPGDFDREEKNVTSRIDFLKQVDRGVEKLRKHADALVADLAPKEREILQKRGILTMKEGDKVWLVGQREDGTHQVVPAEVRSVGEEEVCVNTRLGCHRSSFLTSVPKERVYVTESLAKARLKELDG